MERTDPTAPEPQGAAPEPLEGTGDRAPSGEARPDGPRSGRRSHARWLFPLAGLLILGAVAVVLRQRVVEAELQRLVDTEADLEAAKERERAAIAAAKSKLVERRALLDARLGKMARVPGQAFELGSNEQADEQPVLRVSLEGFEIDVLEVTAATYRACVDAGRCTPPGTGGACTWERPDRAEHPVNCVDHAQAAAFCAWAAKRLPTEDEWELASRGPRGLPYPWGSSAPSTEPCWRRTGRAGEPPAGTCRAGEKADDRSGFGLLDLAGNVREWTASAHCPYGNRACGAASRVLRGGSFRDTDPLGLRASARGKLPPETRADDVGFRCARGAFE